MQADSQRKYCPLLAGLLQQPAHQKSSSKTSQPSSRRIVDTCMTEALSGCTDGNSESDGCAGYHVVLLMSKISEHCSARTFIPADALLWSYSGRWAAPMGRLEQSAPRLLSFLRRPYLHFNVSIIILVPIGQVRPSRLATLTYHLPSSPLLADSLDELRLVSLL
jgi:hypothetical protein